MSTSKVDMVFGVKATLISDILNRLAICQLAPLSLPTVELLPSNTQGEVLVRVLTITFALRTEVAQGNLRVFVELREVPDWLEENVRPIANRSPYDLKLEGLSPWLHLYQSGLKIGAQNDTLLFGVEFSEGEDADWNHFYTAYTGNDLIGQDKQWGVTARRQLVDQLIYRIADDVITEMAGQVAGGLSAIDLTEIKWPGDYLRLKGTGSYDMECSIVGSAEIDFRWEAQLRLQANISKLSAELHLSDIDPRGEEDAIQAAVCSLSFEDLLFGLLTLFTSLINKLLAAVFSDQPTTTITKEIVDLAWPQTGRLWISDLLIATDGVTIQGIAADETGTSEIDTAPERRFSHTIRIPFYCYRPSEPIDGTIQITNSGGASLTLCGAEFEAARDSIVVVSGGDWAVTTPVERMPIIVLPGEQTTLGVRFHPSEHAEFNQDYRKTLVLNTVKKTVNNIGNAIYADEETRIDVVATYHYQHYGAVFHQPDIGVGIDYHELNLDVILEKPMIDVTVNLPWADIPLANEAIEVVSIASFDPVVATLQVLDAGQQVVAETESQLAAKRVAVALQPGRPYSLLLKGRPGVNGGDHPPEGQSAIRTLATCTKSVFVPAAQIKTDTQIRQVVQVGHWLLIVAGGELLCYDRSDPAKPTLGSMKRLGQQIAAVALDKRARTADGGHLLACIVDGRVMLLEWAGVISGRLRASVLGERPLAPEIIEPHAILIADPICVVAGIDRLAILDVRNRASLSQLATVQLKTRIYATAIARHSILIGTESGVEGYCLRSPAAPVHLGAFGTDSPVTRLEVSGPLIYATFGKDDTMVLSLARQQFLSQVGRRRDPLRATGLVVDDEIGYTIAGDRRQLTLFTRQAALADLQKLGRFTRH